MMGLRSVPLLCLLLAYAAADCPPGTIYESTFNKCYKFVNVPSSFLLAEQTCNSIGGHLVSIQNAFENSYVAGLVSGAAARTPNYWIGANLLLTSSWSWTANASFTYANWANGQPITSNPCGIVRDLDSKWLTGACNSLLPFVCAVDPNASQPGTPGTCPTQSPAPTCSPAPSNSSNCPNDAVCSAGYTLYNGNCLCYKYFTTSLYYNDAKTSCVQEGGILASSTSADVNEFLTILPGIDCRGGSCPYIGLYCTSSSLSDCNWADGSTLGNYTNFFYDSAKQASPPGYVTSFAFVAAPPLVDPDQRGTWEPQTDQRSYICQKASTTMSMLVASWKEEDNNSNAMAKIAGKSRSDVN